MFKPKFTITSEINNRIAIIEKLKALIDHAVILPELEVQLRFRATVEQVHSSTSIEGNVLNKPQVQKVLTGKTVSAPDYAIVEVLNYKKALDWLQYRPHSQVMLKTEDILHIHQLVMHSLLPKEKTGRFRSGDIFIVDEIAGNEKVQYVGPPARNVSQLVASLLQWIPLQIKSQLHPVLLSGLLHYLFISIHPFADGNGRTTRLLTGHYLQTWGYDFRQSLSLDTFYVQHQQAYYDALSRGTTFDQRMKADITPFLDFFTTGFLEAAQQLTQHIKVGKITPSEEKTLRLDSDQLAILDYVYQFGSISIQEALEILTVPKRTAQRRLSELVEKGVLLMSESGPATKYSMGLH